MEQKYPPPREGALTGITDLALDDVQEKMVFPFGPDGKGYVAYYPDAQFVHAVSDAASQAIPLARPHLRYQILTGQGSCEKGNREEDWAPRLAGVTRYLREHGIELPGSPPGYPHVDAVIAAHEDESDRVEFSELSAADRGQWFLQRSSRLLGVGLVLRDHAIFEFEKIDRGHNVANEEVRHLYARPIGLPVPHEDMPHELQIRETRRWAEGFDYPMSGLADAGGFYNGCKQIRQYPRLERAEDLLGHSAFLEQYADIALFRLDRMTAKSLVKMRLPGSYYSNGNPYEREQYALQSALDALQYIRARNPADDRAGYVQSLTLLVERFGEPFFREVAWGRLCEHLARLVIPRPQDQTAESGRPFSDLMVFPHTWMGIVRTLIDNAHAVPDLSYDQQHGDYNRAYGPYVRPLFGDVEFWAAMRMQFPETFHALAGRWLSLPDSQPIHPVHGAQQLVDPRDLMRQHFEEAHRYLSSS